jgi:hypothetical protein
MNTYTWLVTSINVFPKFNGKENVVVEVKFCVSGTDGKNTVTKDGSQSIQLNDQELFVDYADLTQTSVVSWVKDALGESGQYTYTAEIDAILEQKKTPVVLPINAPLPWKLQPQA